MHVTLLSQNARKQDNEGRGVSLPYERLQTTFLTTENPLVFIGEKTKTLKQTRPYQRGNKKGQIRPKRVSLNSNHKGPLMKVLKHENTSLFYIMHKN